MKGQSILRKFTLVIALILSLGLMLTGLLLPVKSYAATEPSDPTAGNVVTVAFKINNQFKKAFNRIELIAIINGVLESLNA